MSAAQKKRHFQIAGGVGGTGTIIAAVWIIVKFWPVISAVATAVPQVRDNTARIVIAEQEIIECKSDLRVFEARNSEQHKALMDIAKETREDVRTIREKL